MNKRTTKNLLFCTGLITTTCIFESNSLEQLDKNPQETNNSRGRSFLNQSNFGTEAVSRLWTSRRSTATYITRPDNLTAATNRRSLPTTQAAAPTATPVNQTESHPVVNSTPAPTPANHSSERGIRTDEYKSRFKSVKDYWLKKIRDASSSNTQTTTANRPSRINPSASQAPSVVSSTTTMPSASVSSTSLTQVVTTTPSQIETPTPAPQTAPVVSETTPTVSALVSNTPVTPVVTNENTSNPNEATPAETSAPSSPVISREVPSTAFINIHNSRWNYIMNLTKDDIEGKTHEKSGDKPQDKKSSYIPDGNWKSLVVATGGVVNRSTDKVVEQVNKLLNHHNSTKTKDDDHTVKPSDILGNKSTETVVSTADTPLVSNVPPTEPATPQTSDATNKDLVLITPDSSPETNALEPTDTTSPTQIFDEENPAPTPSEVSEPTPTSVDSVTDEPYVEPTPEVTPIGHPTESPSQGSDSQPSSSASETDTTDSTNETDAQTSGSDSSVTDTSSATLITVDAPTDELVAESTAPVEPLSSNDSTDSNESPTEPTSDSADDKVELPQSESAPLQDASPSQDDQLPVDQTTEPTGSNDDASSTSVVAEAETPTPVEGENAPTVDQTTLEDQDDSSSSSSDSEPEGDNLGADEGAPVVDQDDSSSSSSDSEDEKRAIELTDTLSKEEVASASSSPKGSLDEPRSPEGTPKSARRSFMSKLNPAKIFGHKRTESDASGTSTPPATESGSISPEEKKKKRSSVRFVLDLADQVLHRKKDKKPSESTAPASSPLASQGLDLAQPTAPVASAFASQGSDVGDLTYALGHMLEVDKLLPGTSPLSEVEEGFKDVADFVEGTIKDAAAEVKEKVDDIIHHHDVDSAATSESTQSASESAPANFEATPVVTEEPQVEQYASTPSPVSADETTAEASTSASTKGSTVQSKDFIDDAISTLWLPHDSSPWHFPNPNAPDSRELALEQLPGNSIESTSTATSDPAVKVEPIPSSSSAEVSREASLEERGADEKGDNKYQSKDEKKGKEKNKKQDKENHKNKKADNDNKTNNKLDSAKVKKDRKSKIMSGLSSVANIASGVLNIFSGDKEDTSNGNSAAPESNNSNPISVLVHEIGNIAHGSQDTTLPPLAPNEERLDDGTIIRLKPTSRYTYKHLVGHVDYIVQFSEVAAGVKEFQFTLPQYQRLLSVGLEAGGNEWGSKFKSLETLDLTAGSFSNNNFEEFINGFKGKNTPLTVLRVNIVDDTPVNVNLVTEIFPNLKSFVVRGVDLLVAPVVEPTPTATVATLTPTDSAHVDNVVPFTPVEAAPTETVTAKTPTDSALEGENK